MSIRVENLFFSYGSKSVLEDVNFEIKEKSICAILGCSGSGKSTILHLLSGLESICYSPDQSSSHGSIKVDGNVVDNGKKFSGSESRNLTLIFQTPSLFPHKTILENLEFAIRSGSSAVKQQKAREALDQVEMNQYYNHLPSQLSIGQQQRVALVRSVLGEAAIILLDEPFSGLDFESKFLLYKYLLKARRKRPLTIVLVTHDFEEAAFFADSFLVIDNKKVKAYDSVLDMYKKPCNSYCASLFPFTNIFCGARGGLGGFCKMKTPEHNLHVIRPENIRIIESDSSISSNSSVQFVGNIEQIKHFGTYSIFVIALRPSEEMIFCKLQYSRISENFKVGQNICAYFNNEDVFCI